MEWIGLIFNDGTIHVQKYEMMKKEEMVDYGFMEESIPSDFAEIVEAETEEEAEDKLRQRFNKGGDMK